MGVRIPRSGEITSRMCHARCNYGYFVDGNTSLTEQTVECLGQLGGWYPPTIADCYRVEGEQIMIKRRGRYQLCSCTVHEHYIQL